MGVMLHLLQKVEVVSLLQTLGWDGIGPPKTKGQPPQLSGWNHRAQMANNYGEQRMKKTGMGVKSQAKPRDPERNTKQRTLETAHCSSKASKEPVDTAQRKDAERCERMREWKQAQQSQSALPTIDLSPPGLFFNSQSIWNF